MTVRFVVGVDGSETADKALVWAARLAALHGAEVHPVLAWELPIMPMWADGVPTADLRLADELQAYNEENAAAVLERVGDLPATVTAVRVVRGEPGHVLCRVAEELEAELLVMGSRGLGGFKGLLVGSATAHCANAAPCPLAVIPPHWEPAAAPTGQVAVGVDGSKHSNQAVQWADRWISPETTLRLIHTWQVPLTIDRFNRWFEVEACEDSAKQLVAGVASSVERHAVVTEAVCTDAREQLTDLAADADALVVGARGHRGLGRLLLGSVASSTLHHLQVPTIVVR